MSTKIRKCVSFRIQFSLYSLLCFSHVILQFLLSQQFRRGGRVGGDV